MGMKLTIHQPEFIPWLGFLDKSELADKIVLLDNVQYRHKYFQNRNQVKTKTGPVWLNVPIKRNGKTRDIGLIKDIEIDNSKNWKDKITKTIHYNYCKAPQYKCYSDQIHSTINNADTNLCNLNIEIIKTLFKLFNIGTEIVRASELNVSGSGEKLILDIASIFQPSIYISGPTGIAGRGKDHEKYFNEKNIQVIYHDYEHEIYPQQHGEFIPYMSGIDKLFNQGPL